MRSRDGWAMGMKRPRPVEEAASMKRQSRHSGRVHGCPRLSTIGGRGGGAHCRPPDPPGSQTFGTDHMARREKSSLNAACICG